MKNNPQIALILPYFGSWPEWFKFFLKSCSWNPTIKWLLYSDNSISHSLPENVHLVNITLSGLSSLINKEVGIVPQIIHPYKLVDFKPAYGLIFRKDITGYDFWGYTDLDLIYGNISHFITSDILINYDIISPGKELIPGHFALFRNVEKINTLFMDNKHWQSVLSDPKCFCFDEKFFKKGFELNEDAIRNFIESKIENHIRKSRFLKSEPIASVKKTLQKLHKYLPERNKPLQDFNQIINYHRYKNHLRLLTNQFYSDDIMKLREMQEDYIIKWKQGSLYDSEKEIMYFHFQLSKYKGTLHFNNRGEEDFDLVYCQ